MVIRNYKLLKIIDLKVNLLEPSASIKNNEQLSVYQMATRFLWSWRGLNPRPNVELIRFLHA